MRTAKSERETIKGEKREREGKGTNERKRETRREKSGTSGPLETNEHAYM